MLHVSVGGVKTINGADAPPGLQDNVKPSLTIAKGAKDRKEGSVALAGRGVGCGGAALGGGADARQLD